MTETLGSMAIFYRLWSQLLQNFIIPQVPKSPPKERKVVIVGITRLLTQSTRMLSDPLAQAWYVVPLFPYHPLPFPLSHTLVLGLC